MENEKVLDEITEVSSFYKSNRRVNPINGELRAPASPNDEEILFS